MTAFSLVGLSLPAVAMPQSAGRTGAAARMVPAPHLPTLIQSSPLKRPVATLPHGAGVASGAARMSLKPVREITADRTATSSTWLEPDGSLMVRDYLAPQYYRTASGWQPISTSLASAPGHPGWWQSTANSWRVSFGPAGAAGGAERIAMGGATFGFTPLGVADPGLAPQASHETATYRGLWPGVDVQDEVTATGVKESIVLAGPGTSASFAFRLDGATAQVRADGGLDVLADGRVIGSIPALTVSTRQGLTETSGARLTADGGVVTVSVSPGWLASLPKSAFPVVIDPTFGGVTNQTQTVSLGSNGTVKKGILQVGKDSSGVLWRDAAWMPFPTLPAALSGTKYVMSIGGYISNCTTFCGMQGDETFGLSTAKTATPTYAGITAGKLLYQALPGVTDEFLHFGGVTNATDIIDLNYLKSRTDGWWIGGLTVSGVEVGNTLIALNPSSTDISFFFVEQPPATSVTAPANGSVLPTATPTLTSSAATGGDNPIYYDFRIATTPTGGGTVVDSGWLTNSTSWTVPPGSLHDGVTYYATVLNAISDQWDTSASSYVPPNPAKAPVSFTVKERLGDGGPSPTDAVGAPPDSTTTPSAGAPSPGLSTASETVDLVTGNLAVTQSMHSLTTVSGQAGVSLTYNSSHSSVSNGTNYGLTGSYYPDSGNHTFPANPVGQRADPEVDMSWDDNPPLGGLTPDTAYLVRWTGELTLPSGTWALGGVTTGGMRVFLNGSTTPTYNDWAGTASTTIASYATTTVAGSAQYQIEVDEWDRGAASTRIQLWAKNTAITDTTVPSAFIAPSSWLTPTATGLPPGWGLAANPASATWNHADDQGSQVVLTSSSGLTATFTRQASGEYKSPTGDQDFLSVNGIGQLQLSTSTGQIYAYNPDGTLASMTTATDDTHPASLTYTYSGTPPVLRGITDPVSGQTITLSYGRDSACTGNTYPVAAGLLCKIAYWDGTDSQLGYNTNGQLAAVVSPGPEYTLLGYDSDSRLAEIRDPLATQYSKVASPTAPSGAASEPSNCATDTLGQGCQLDTAIGYDSSGRVSTVTQPVPLQSQLGTTSPPRPERTYSYASGSTTMSIAGFSPTSGFAKKVLYDSADRITETLDSAEHATHVIWNGSDQPLAQTNTAGLQTSTVYDASGNVSDTYGPAPAACYSGGWPAGVSPSAPFVGYLPVASPQNTTGCLTAVPHTHHGFDEGITSLAAKYWSNGQFGGSPTLHGTGIPGTQPTAFCTAATGVLCGVWASGTTPVTVDTAGNWSLRLTGTISIATAGAYTFQLAASQVTTLSVDFTKVVTDKPATAGTASTAKGTTASLTAGTHFIEVDFTGQVNQLSEFGVSYGLSTATTFTEVPNTILDPDYGLQTSSTDADGKVTKTQYSNATIGPELGLTTATIADPAGLALTTTSSYEAPGTGFLRKTASKLPSGATTSYVYYGGTDGPLAAACGVSAGTPQAGLLQSKTDPAPASGTSAREQQYIYDASGRQVGTRTGTTADIASQAWQCTYYDSLGRLTSQTWPTFNGAPARTVTYTYGNTATGPLTSTVTDSLDPGATISATVDFLGRVTSYTDAHGKTTTTGYDQAGRTTTITEPAGTITMAYDPNSSQPTTTALNGTTLATASYDSVTGRLTGVSYATGIAATIGYALLGTENSLQFKSTAAGLITGDRVTVSLAGRDTSELMDINGTSLTNPNPAGSTATDYTYDAAGRLTDAYLANGSLAHYGYAENPASDNCPAPGAGADTNRTSVTVTPSSGTATTTDSCYNGADQLTGTVSGGTVGAGSYSYDEHGNQTADGATALTWDAADRLASTTPASGTTTTCGYDAVNRVISRTAGTTTTGYWYSGFSDSPAGTLNASGNVTASFIAVPGGVTITVQSAGNVWSYPDLHGNYTATTDASGTPHGGRSSYDPWGQLLPGATPAANTPGGSNLGAYGTSGKVTDTASGIITMGARGLNPAEARFLSVDPIQGGCANPYVYAFGDPLNHGDLSGQAACAPGTVAVAGTPPPFLAGCSASLWTLSASCTIAVSPAEAKKLVAELASLPGTVGASIVTGAICGALGFAGLGPVGGFVAGVVCGAITAAGVWEIGNWLQEGVDQNAWSEITVGVDFTSTSPVYVKSYHTPATCK